MQLRFGYFLHWLPLPAPVLAISGRHREPEGMLDLGG